MKVIIPDDIRKYKAKDIGMFSFKEIGFIVVAIAMIMAGYKFLGSLEIGLIPAGVVIAFGFFKPQGMSLMKYIRTVIREKTLPKTFDYDSDFEFTETCGIKELFGDEYSYPSAEALTQRDKVVVINKKTKKNTN
jgi:hypothetical protein